MAKKKIVLYQENDQFIQVVGLQDAVTGSYISVATVTATIKDRAGVTVPQVDNLALTYVPATNGNYRGLVQDTFNPPKGGGYTLFIDADDQGVKLHLELPVEVQIRAS